MNNILGFDTTRRLGTESMPAMGRKTFFDPVDPEKLLSRRGVYSRMVEMAYHDLKYAEAVRVPVGEIPDLTVFRAAISKGQGKHKQFASVNLSSDGKWVYIVRRQGPSKFGRKMLGKKKRVV